MIVADDLELDPIEVEFVAALAALVSVRVLKRALPRPSGPRPSAAGSPRGA